LGRVKKISALGMTAKRKRPEGFRAPEKAGRKDHDDLHREQKSNGGPHPRVDRVAGLREPRESEEDVNPNRHGGLSQGNEGKPAFQEGRSGSRKKRNRSGAGRGCKRKRRGRLYRRSARLLAKERESVSSSRTATMGGRDLSSRQLTSRSAGESCEGKRFRPVLLNTMLKAVESARPRSMYYTDRQSTRRISGRSRTKE